MGRTAAMRNLSQSVSPGSPVDGGLNSCTLSTGSLLKYAFLMSAQHRIFAFKAVHAIKRLSPSTSHVGESFRASGQFSNCPHPTNLDLHFLIYPGCPLRCSCLSLSTHCSGLTQCPLSIKSCASFP